MRAVALAAALVGVVAMVAGQSTAKGAAGAEPEATLRKLSDKLREAALKGDAATMEELHADDYMSISALTGAPSNKADLVNNYKSGKLKYEALDTSDVKVQVYGPTTALVTAKVVAKGKLGDHEFSGTFWSARVWVKRGGKWRVVFLQSTSVPTQVRSG